MWRWLAYRDGDVGVVGWVGFVHPLAHRSCLANHGDGWSGFENILKHYWSSGHEILETRCCVVQQSSRYVTPHNAWMASGQKKKIKEPSSAELARRWPSEKVVERVGQCRRRGGFLYNYRNWDTGCSVVCVPTYATKKPDGGGRQTPATCRRRTLFCVGCGGHLLLTIVILLH